MSTPKKYFHDHLVLLLLSINAFLAIAGSIFILVRLSTSHGNGYIVACRDCSNPVALNKFANGSVIDLLSFVGFALIVPARYYINIAKGVFLKDIGIRLLWFDLLLLLIYGAGVFYLATRKLRQKVA